MIGSTCFGLDNIVRLSILVFYDFFALQWMSIARPKTTRNLTSVEYMSFVVFELDHCMYDVFFNDDDNKNSKSFFFSFSSSSSSFFPLLKLYEDVSTMCYRASQPTVFNLVTKNHI